MSKENEKCEGIPNECKNNHEKHKDWIDKVSSALDHITILDPKSIPKYVNQLVTPPVYEPTIITDPTTGDVLRHEHTVDVSEFKQQILPPGFPKTTVWGYGGLVKDPDTGESVYFRNTPGATFEAIRGIPIHVQWVNNLTGPHLFAVDPTLHWANPNMMPMNPPLPWPPFPPGFPNAQRPVPIVPHLHGGEVPSASDGHPYAWFTAGTIRKPFALFGNKDKQPVSAMLTKHFTPGRSRFYAGIRNR